MLRCYLGMQIFADISSMISVAVFVSFRARSARRQPSCLRTAKEMIRVTMSGIYLGENEAGIVKSDISLLV